MKELIEELEIYLGNALEAATRGDEDAWLTAMTDLRDCAWSGKALVLDKRLAEWRATRTPLALRSPTTKSPRVVLGVSTLEDMLL